MLALLTVLLATAASLTLLSMAYTLTFLLYQVIANMLLLLYNCTEFK